MTVRVRCPLRLQRMRTQHYSTARTLVVKAIWLLTQTLAQSYEVLSANAQSPSRLYLRLAHQAEYVVTYPSCFGERWMSKVGVSVLSMLPEGSMRILYRQRTQSKINFEGHRIDRVLRRLVNCSFSGFFGRLWVSLYKNVEDVAEGWNHYDTELKKLPETHQKTYTDGFVKGLLASKTTPHPTPKKSNTLTRFYIFLVACILIGYLMGAIRIRIGDRQLGSLFFSNTQEVKPEDIQVTFEDVRGMDEAKQEVEEIVSYLRDPERYSRLGGRLPKGVLLVGPPGTGKTLLARAVAGEAQVPFFHTSGSEFDEVLVGQGARRVRDLFDKAKARAPCIIFIDEVDSVGSKRVSNSIHPYANQTINQLLSEMDGFNRNEGVIVIAATNRVEDLDKALLRPGRFDVRVTVPKPDLAGRIDIFDFYLQRVVHSPNVDPRVLAKGSTGFTGADIENMVNQAALKAAKECAPEVTMQHLDEARDRILMGPARTGGRIPDEEANKNTAYHEAGHTLVSLYTKHSTPLHKVTIIPRGQSLGHTATLPEKDEYQMTKGQLLAALDVMMGGRVAEELIFGEDMVTTGAADDLKKATMLAVQMVKAFGMSDKVLVFLVCLDFFRSLMANNCPQSTTKKIISEMTFRLRRDEYARMSKQLKCHQAPHRRTGEAQIINETAATERNKQTIKRTKILLPSILGLSNTYGLRTKSCLFKANQT
ncbi:unnamed protein product [Cylicocyclus nassatus]|uniref:AAA+ ATPase domain-containing protein n=1 Tax=Cylicocyclus nassatus TaxID=53992 RepID=A0AA36GXP9_CYLNA|nr:unnamed protein product [Cylicocyclus nassatus]